MYCKYVQPLKLPDGKLEDLIHLNVYIDRRATEWVEEVERSQNGAALVVEEEDPLLPIDLENRNDENNMEDDPVPEPEIF